VEFIGCFFHSTRLIQVTSAFREVTPSPSARWDESDPRSPAGIVLSMVRPCFLVIDREFPGSISTRKLVIETAKFNVLTAYSAQEGIDTLRMFSAIHGVVLDSEIPGMSCGNLVQELKKVKAGIPVIAICGPGDSPCPDADHELESFDPRRLLALLQSLLPKEADAIEKREEELNRDL
jgi:DNA-binding NtrC family response regulator